jgi:hypothetical protein
MIYGKRCQRGDQTLRKHSSRIRLSSGAGYVNMFEAIRILPEERVDTDDAILVQRLINRRNGT